MSDTEDKGKPSGLEVELAVADVGTVEQPPPQDPPPPPEGDPEDHDEGVPAGEDDEDRKARADRRRRARERKRQQEEQMLDALARQGEVIEQLVGQVQHLSQHAQGSNLTAVEQAYAQAKAAMKTAYESGDAMAVAEATETLTIARLNLDAAKHRRPAQPQRRQPADGQERQQQPNPYQAEWMSRNGWYRDPERQEDAAVAYAISKTLEAEGYAPNDPDHFVELDRRLKKRGVTTQQSGHKPPPVTVASGQRQSLTPTKNKVVISPRVQEHARKFGIDLSDKATAERIARRLQTAR